MEGGVYVINRLIKRSEHLTEVSLKGFKEGSLGNNELILLSEHICSCEGCADILANSFTISELVDAPLGFQQEILDKIDKKKTNNTQFAFYSLRVVMAASIALMFVFSNSLSFLANSKTAALNINPVNLRGINTVNVGLNNFSQKIINMEVFNNEKRKK
jgi:hypothetical protein